MDTNAVSFQAPVAAPQPPKPKNSDEAAGQFEALLLTQMLRAAQSEQDQEDSTMDTMWDMAAQQFAQVMADAGGLGLARMIREDLGASEGSATPENSRKDPAKSNLSGPLGPGSLTRNAAPIPIRSDEHK